MNPREQILSLATSSKPVPLAETPQGWPEGLCLRRPTLNVREEIGDKLKSGPNGSTPPDALAFILARLVVDATGSRVFDDDDATALGELPWESDYKDLATQAIRLVAGVDLDNEGHAKNR